MGERKSRYPNKKDLLLQMYIVPVPSLYSAPEERSNKPTRTSISTQLLCFACWRSPVHTVQWLRIMRISARYSLDSRDWKKRHDYGVGSYLYSMQQSSGTTNVLVGLRWLRGDTANGGVMHSNHRPYRLEIIGERRVHPCLANKKASSYIQQRLNIIPTFFFSRRFGFVFFALVPIFSLAVIFPLFDMNVCIYNCRAKIRSLVSLWPNVRRLNRFACFLMQADTHQFNGNRVILFSIHQISKQHRLFNTRTNRRENVERKA